jgi:hypothetical protein
MEESKLCCYGCGQEAKFRFKNGKECCSENMNGCPEIRRIRKDSSLKSWNDVKNKGKILLKEIGNKRNRSLKPEFCEYGCGLNAEHQLKNGKWCCSDSSNKCPNNRRKNSERIKSLYDCGKLKQDYQNISQGSKDRMRWSKGLTKETNGSLNKMSETLGLRYKNKELIHPFLGKHHTEDSKIKMKKTNGGYRKHAGRGKQGWYKNYECDSSWELAYVIYNLEHGIKFERNNEGFEYEFKGSKFKFYPDFILEDGSYVEIKGWLDEKNKAKIASFKKELVVLGNREIKPFLDYAIERYGKNFVSLYEISSIRKNTNFVLTDKMK